jgi:hypothetical protein
MTHEILQRLAEPFPGDVVKWRAQGKPHKRGSAFYARVVAYVDARIVIDRLNTVMGLDWQKRTTETPKGRVLCSLGITLPDGREVWRDDGAGDTDIEGEKGAISDALKRAAVQFGIGAYLYALPSPSVEVEVDERGDKVYLRGLTRESREKLARLAQRSLDQWSADLRAMDASADETGEAQQSASPPPPPPPPAREVKREPPPKDEAPSEKKDEDGKRDPQTKGGRKFAPPTRARGDSAEKRKEAWQVWSRQPLAAIKASSSREEAILQIEANAEAYDLLKRDTGTDGRAHAMSVINRRWPVADALEKPDYKPAGKFIVPLPDVHTKGSLDKWAGRVLDLMIREAESMSQVDEILRINAEGMKLASAEMQTDVPEMARGFWEKQKNPASSKKAGRAR